MRTQSTAGWIRLSHCCRVTIRQKAERSFSSLFPNTEGNHTKHKCCTTHSRHTDRSLQKATVTCSASCRNGQVFRRRNARAEDVWIFKQLARPQCRYTPSGEIALTEWTEHTAVCAGREADECGSGARSCTPIPATRLPVSATLMFQGPFLTFCTATI